MLDGSVTINRSTPRRSMATRVLCKRSANSAREKFNFGSITSPPSQLRNKLNMPDFSAVSERVDRPLFLGWFLRPIGQQTPLQQVKVPGAGVVMAANDRSVLRRRDVPGRCQTIRRPPPTQPRSTASVVP